MDAAARGQKALDAGNTETAISEYTVAISANPNAPNYYLKRSSAYQRSNQLDKALQDAEIATTLAYKRQKRELISEAQRRRMAALYQLGRYADAQFVWGIAKKMDEKEKTLPIWEVRIRNALGKLGEGDENATRRVMENPNVEVAVDASDSTKKEKEKDAPAPASNGQSGSETSKPSIPAPKPTPSKQIKHDWYQNDDNVVVNLMAKGVPKDKATVEIEASSLSISFPAVDNAEYNFSLDPLWAFVDPQESKWRITPTKVEVTLRKLTRAVKWKSLERTEGDPSSVESERTVSITTSKAEDKAPAYPTSSRHGTKNWDKLVENDEGEPYDEYEGDETTRFFKHLYKGATPEQQRAMMKSYQESGGTVLSTDWSEVGKKEVKPEPPEGMEEKKYGA